MAKRKAISKKTRFEVFKRDSFACQYCGKAAPDVILHVDHIDPVSKGGDNSIINLITACADCNGGKSDTRLDDNSTLAKQRDQLAELSERREQLKMMVDWRKGMKGLADQQVEAAQEHFSTCFPGYELTNAGAVASIKTLLRKYGLSELMQAMEIAAEAYLRYTDGVVTAESVSAAWHKVGGICFNRSKPDESGLYYARGILRKRVYVDERFIMGMLRDAREAGATDAQLQRAAKECRTWTEFRSWISELVDGEGA